MMTQRQTGFTVVELLIAATVMLVVSGAALALVAPLRSLFEAASASADLSQRVRAGAAILTADIAQAGSGLMILDEHGGFGALLPALLPDALPPVGAGPRPIAWQASTITSMHVPSSAAQATLASATAGAFDPLVLRSSAFCPETLPPCGFAAGIPVLVFDASGAWDIVAVSGIADHNRSLLHASTPLTSPYNEGSIVARLARRTYSLREDAATGAATLVRDDGGGVAQPVLDHVVSFAVEWLGEAQPPAVRAVDDEGWSWTTYGPPPPPVAEGASGAWPPGENCVFSRSAGGVAQPRLAAIGSGQALARLTEDVLTDGPWCPDSWAPGRYDADLLRVRQIVIDLRVQVASAALRGPAGVLFGRGGTGRGRVLVPDRQVRFAVAPRSLMWER
jgi:hypothetical protein